MAEQGVNDAISGSLKGTIYAAFVVALAALVVALYHHHSQGGKVHLG